jgi:hypothetical protein
VRKLSPHRSERHGYGGAVAYLRVENPRFLFLGGSADAVAAASVATALPPVVSAVRAGTSAARVASPVGCLAAGAPAPAPGAVSSAASAAMGEGGEGSHLSGGARPPSLSSSSFDDEYSEVVGEESPATRAAGTPHFSVPGAPIAGSSSPSCAPPALAPAAAPCARVLGLGAWAGRTARRSRPSPTGGE